MWFYISGSWGKCGLTFLGLGEGIDVPLLGLKSGVGVRVSIPGKGIGVLINKFSKFFLFLTYFDN